MAEKKTESKEDLGFNGLSGFEGYLNEQQSEALKALNKEMQGTEYYESLKSHPDGDRYTLRFLRATMKDKGNKRIFQVEDAKNRLLETLAWRKENKVDEVMATMKEPDGWDEFLKVKPSYRYIDESLGGRPVTFERFGTMANYMDSKCFTNEQWDSFFIFQCEQTMQMMREESEKRGYEVSDSVVVLDESHLGSGFLNKIRFFKRMSAIAQERYPEMVKAVNIVHAPWVFAGLFNAIKPFLDPMLIKKLKITSNVPEELIESLDRKLVPKEYGGESDVIVGVCKHAPEKIHKQYLGDDYKPSKSIAE